MPFFNAMFRPFNLFNFFDADSPSGFNISIQFESFGDAWLQNLIYNYLSKQSTCHHNYKNLNFSIGL